MKSALLVIFFAIVAVVIVFNEDKQDHNQFTSDACGYYIYLPATFIYHDLGHMDFYPALDSEYHHSLGINYSLRFVKGKTLDKYPVGVAIFELPFFLIANSYCRATLQYKADGFTLPYQVGGMLGNIFWAVVGLFVLRRFLNRYFNDNITTITLLCIAFGTNLYVYATFIVGMSHVYSFFLFSWLLLLTDSWYRDPDSKLTTIMTGLVAGLIFIVRPVNIIALLVPLLWMVGSRATLKARLMLFAGHYRQVLLMCLAFCLVAFMQFSYWKLITGHWLVYSYDGERFDFLHPNIVNGLFSYRKGWFLYTPLALIGLSGFYFLWKRNRNMLPALAVFFLAFIYVVFSWEEWWYGGGFGCRPLIESLAFLALPLAAMTGYIFESPSKIKKATFSLVLLSIIFLNIFQTYQYSMGLIHWGRMTKAYYWRVFGKVDFDRASNEQYLMTPEDEQKKGNQIQH